MRGKQVAWVVGFGALLLGLVACSDSDEDSEPAGTGGQGVGGKGSGGQVVGGKGSGGQGVGGKGSGGQNVGGQGSGGTGAGGRGSGGRTATGGAPTTGGVSTGGVTVVPPAAYCDPTEAWDAEWAALEQEILVLVNQVRAAGATCGGTEFPPTGPLTMDPALQCAARVHSMDMANRNFFDHTNPDGDGPDERMDAAGYDGRGWGENIAAGRDTAAGTMDQWMNSSGHCSNIMSSKYTLIGVGYYPGGRYDTLWTQTFGG